MDENSIWLIWPDRPALSLLAWLAVACLGAGLTRDALIGCVRRVRNNLNDTCCAGENWLRVRALGITRQRIRYELARRRRNLSHDLQTRYRQVEWLSDAEAARLRAAGRSLERVVSQVERGLPGGDPERSDDPEYPPIRSDVTAALLGWRRVVRLQGDIGRSLVRLERADETSRASGRELQALDKAVVRTPGSALWPEPLLQGVLKWLVFLAVLVANSVLLVPGMNAIGAPGPGYAYLFIGALLLAQFITAHTCWQQAGRWLRVLGLALVLAWSGVMGLLAVLALSDGTAFGETLVRALLGALVPLWILAASQWLPDLINLSARLLESALVVVLDLLRLALALVRRFVDLVDTFWSGLVTLVASPVTTLLRLLRAG